MVKIKTITKYVKAYFIIFETKIYFEINDKRKNEFTR